MSPPSNAAEAAFAAVISAVDGVRTRSEITVAEAPSPKRLAPYSLTRTATVLVGGEEVADGRLVILYDPQGQEAWQGSWRVVMFASAELDEEMAEDPVLIDVGWTWLEEVLGERDLAIVAFGGTVTRTASHSFGSLAGRPAVGELEIRSSWTPVVEAPHPGLPGTEVPEILRAHVEAWLELLATISALGPVEDGVAPFRRPH